MTFLNDTELCDYSLIASLFIDLRGKGVSLSSADLETISAWEKDGLKPEFIMQVMLEYADECNKKAKNFPGSLAPISRRLHSILIKSSEA